MDRSLPGSCPWNFPGKNTGVVCHFLLQGIFPTQGSNPGLPHCRLFNVWALVAQLIKNPPAMWETWVWSLGWEDPLEKGKATQLQYSGLENSMYCTGHGVAKSRTERLSLSLLFRCSLDGEVFMNEKCNLLFLSPTNLLPIPCSPFQDSACVFNPLLSLSHNSLLLRCVLYTS